EDALPGRSVALLRGRADRLAGMADARAPSRRRRGPKLPVEAEQPEAVAVRRGRKRVPARVEDEVFLAVPLEDRRRVVRTRARLEAPELLAAAGVVGLEASVVAPDEDEVPGGRRRAGVARLSPALLPDDLPARRVDRRERAAVRAEAAADRERAPDRDLYRRRRLLLLRRLGSLGGVAGDPALRAHVEHVRLRVVARRLPVRAALRTRRQHRHRLPVRLEH